MDTLCSDLFRLINSFSRASDAILLGIDIGDNQEILDIFGGLAKFKIALQTNNRYWINELIISINNPVAIKWALKFNHHEIAKYLITAFRSIINVDKYKYNNVKHLAYLYKYKYYKELQSELQFYGKVIDNYLPYYYYLCGRNGVDINVDSLTVHCKNSYLRGLSRGQHKNLFERYGELDIITMDSYLNFDDENYVVTKLETINPIEIQSLNITRNLISRAICINKLKIAKCLLTRLRLDEGDLKPIIEQAILKSRIDLLPKINKVLFPNVLNLEFNVYRACINSDIESLEFIYDRIDPRYKDTFEWLIKKHYVSYAVHAYYVKISGQNDVVPDERKQLIGIIEQLRPYTYTTAQYSGYENVIRDIVQHSIKQTKSLKTIKEILTILYRNGKSIDDIVKILNGYYLHDDDTFYCHFIKSPDRRKLIKSIIN